MKQRKWDITLLTTSILLLAGWAQAADEPEPQESVLRWKTSAEPDATDETGFDAAADAGGNNGDGQTSLGGQFTGAPAPFVPTPESQRRVEAAHHPLGANPNESNSSIRRPRFMRGTPTSEPTQVTVVPPAAYLEYPGNINPYGNGSIMQQPGMLMYWNSATAPNAGTATSPAGTVSPAYSASPSPSIRRARFAPVTSLQQPTPATATYVPAKAEPAPMTAADVDAARASVEAARAAIEAARETVNAARASVDGARKKNEVVLQRNDSVRVRHYNDGARPLNERTEQQKAGTAGRTKRVSTNSNSPLPFAWAAGVRSAAATNPEPPLPPVPPSVPPESKDLLNNVPSTDAAGPGTATDPPANANGSLGSASCSCGARGCDGRGCGGSCGSGGCTSGQCDRCEGSGCDCQCADPHWRLIPYQPLGIQFGGWANGGFSPNDDATPSEFNGPVTYNDREDGQFNQLWVYMERPIDDNGWGIGGRVDVLYGTDYIFNEARGLETQDDLSPRWNSSPFYGLAMPQAYMEVGYDHARAKLGHFHRFVGYESSMAVHNFFYSHSYMFQYAEPDNHTGMLTDVDLTDNFTLRGGWDRGWDNWEDDNSNLSILFGGTWDNGCGTSLGVNGTTGKEISRISGINGDRTLYSIVLTHEFFDQFTYVLQHDWAFQNDAIAADDDAEWYGISQYVYYQFAPSWNIGARGEWFRDDDGYRVEGLRPGNPIEGAQFAGNFYEVSLGLNYRPSCNLIVRSEIRYDWYDGAPNAGSGGSRPFGDGSDNDQLTGGVDLIVEF